MAGVIWIDANTASWPEAVDAVRAELGAPANPLLFPPHFLKATFPKIGGRLARFVEAGAAVGYGFLFPRNLCAGRPVYTLRYHAVPSSAREVSGAATETTSRSARLPMEVAADRLRAELDADVVPYDPAAPQRFEPTAQVIATGDEVGRPDAAEAAAIRELQRRIWGSEPDFLYPADIHSTGFGLGTSLVARVRGNPDGSASGGGEEAVTAGFLFGFRTFGGAAVPAAWLGRFRTDFRFESQLMGVLPAYRGRGLAFWLKRLQAEGARAAGVDLINWTVDPLQWGNAVLNLGLLRAVAFGFHPDYYTFRNTLNRLPASRLEITWPIATRRVGAALAGDGRAGSRVVLDLAEAPDVRRLEVEAAAGWPKAVTTAERLAIQVPADWTALQSDDPDRATRWRAETDRLFAALLGPEPGRFVLTGVARSGDRRYLLAERVDDALLDHLGR